MHKSIRLLLTTAVLMSSAAIACSPSNFTIKQVTPQLPDYAGEVNVRVIGEIVNNCDQPAGPHIQLVLRKADGTVADVNDIWPADADNMPAHSTRVWGLNMLAPPRGSKFEASVINIVHWPLP